MTILAPRERQHAGATMTACAALLILFAILSFSAVLTKSATYDEPLHIAGAYIHRAAGDFRINPEDPALFGYWAALPHPSGALKVDYNAPLWANMLQETANNQWIFTVKTLYATPGNDADQFLNRSRFMFIIIGVALGSMIAIWSWQLGGAAAAIIATALFSLDPNFSAHAALVKNDVMLSLIMCALAFSLWRFGKNGNGIWLTTVSLACAAALNVKFSGLICGPIVLATLFFRALLPSSWTVIVFTLPTRWRRLLAATIVCIVVAAVSFASTWACYRFRFAPTDDPAALLNTDRILLRARTSMVQARVPANQITQKMIDDQPLSPMVNFVVWLESKKILPQPWLYGLLYTRATTYIRGGYLLGEVTNTGWWYYFPSAMAFKTPSATLLAIPLALIVFLISKIPRGDPSAREPIDWWTIFCLALTPLLYGASAMAANLNLGIRHILSIYPFIFIAITLALAHLIRRWRTAGSVIAVIIVLGLAAESLSAYPNYLPFFNTLCGGPNAGIDLLGDSNLDWGQDLKLLASWRKANPDQRMYLAYFGTADPHYYGIDEIDVPGDSGGWPFASITDIPRGRCYFAISATNLQGIYVSSPSAQNFYHSLQKQKPIAILGHSIYIFQL
jgi:hypothetical protein